MSQTNSSFGYVCPTVISFHSIVTVDKELGYKIPKFVIIFYILVVRPYEGLIIYDSLSNL